MYLISKKTLYVAIGVVAAVILTAVICNAADHAIGDLKSVTIKFKNDSELKLKTQWFINACDTTWVIGRVDNWRHDEGDTISTEAYIRDLYKFSHDTASGPVDVFYPLVTCKELVGMTVMEKAGWQKKWIISADTLADGTRIPFSNPDFGFYPGQAIIFYEPYKEER